MKPQIVLIGPGRLGTAVGKRLQDAGYPLSAVLGRSLQNARNAAKFIGCDLTVATTDLAQARKGQVVLLALPDDQISDMAKRLQEEIGLSEGTVLVHFSGLHPASIMSLAGSDCTVVSIHPLLSFADYHTAAERLTDCPCALEGNASALPVAEELIAAIGGRAFPLPSDAKALYHAAACVASNYLVTLTAAARDLLTGCGFDQQQALELLLPIHRATSDNLSQLGPEMALTGPIVRGDIGTVKHHLTALTEQMPGLCELYRCLGEKTVELATASGRLKSDQAEKLHQLLSGRDTDPADRP